MGIGLFAGAAVAQETAEQAARRVAAVKALLPPNEGALSEEALLVSLRRSIVHLHESKQAPERGRIEVVFSDLDGRAAPLSGWVSFEVKDASFRFDGSSGIAPVVNGKTTLVIRGEGKYVLMYSDGLPGYAFAKKDGSREKTYAVRFDAPDSGISAQEVVPVEPAGAIRWRVLDENGQPETANIEYSRTILYAGWADGTGGTATAPFGDLMVRTVRFDAKATLLLRKGSRVAMSPPVSVTSENPAVEQVVAFKLGTTVAGRLLNHAGKPVPGATLSLAYTEMKFRATKVVTGEDGGFSFENINLELPEPYLIEFVPSDEEAGDLPTWRVSVDATTRLPLAVRLPNAHEVRGRLLDVNTGVPVPRQQVRMGVRKDEAASRHDAMLMGSGILGIRTRTDEQGYFTLKGLPAGVYEVLPDDGRVVRRKDEAFSSSGRSESDGVHVVRVPEDCREEPQVFWFKPWRKK